MKNDWYVKENGGKGNLVGVASRSSNWFIAEEILPEHAHLIAAAPSLLSALENILNERGEEYGDCDYQSLWKAIEAAKPALAKAKGQGGE